ncbi:MAG: hypothetical protein OXC30_04990 [Alphaproteobacteria bacterium]|nr:hypothetical protein [Alphaproteobacteria bacterium]
MIICLMLVCQVKSAESPSVLSREDAKPFGCIVQMYDQACVLEERVTKSLNLLMEANPKFKKSVLQASCEVLDAVTQEDRDRSFFLQRELKEIKGVLSCEQECLSTFNSRLGSVLDEVLQEDLPDLQKKQSDFATIFRDLHQVGDLAVVVFRCVNLCIDQNAVGEKVAVFRDRIRVEREDEAWGHLDQIPQELQGLFKNQKKHLDDLQKLLAKHDDCATSIPPVLWELIDRRAALCLIYYKEYRAMILQKFCKVANSVNQLQSVPLQLRRVVKMHGEICALEDRAINSLQIVMQGNPMQIKLQNRDKFLPDDMVLSFQEKQKDFRVVLFANISKMVSVLLDDPELLAIAAQETVPNLQQEQSDVMDVLRALHRAGDLVMAVLRRVDLCFDPHGGKKFAVPQEDTRVASQEEGWKNLAQIPERIKVLIAQQEKNLNDLQRLFAQKSYGTQILVSESLFFGARISVVYYMNSVEQ